MRTLILVLLVGCAHAPDPEPAPPARAADPGPPIPSGSTRVAVNPCRFEETEVEMYWRSCATTVADCVERDGRRYLKTPTVGPVVKEAHLVTEGEAFPSGWPSSSRDQLERHYERSGAAIGLPFDRTEPWAPAGEGGSRWGQGSTGAPVPVLDEAWYVTMYWRSRPKRGTRMIIRNPTNGRAVVASAGYETGPGGNRFVAGVVEEIHLHLGTAHKDPLEVGFAADQSLPLGPIDCARAR